MYCADCEKRLRIQRDVKTKGQYYVFQTYASSRVGHRECSIHSTPRHFIEPLILGEIRRVTAFAKAHEAEFMALVEKTHEPPAKVEHEKASQRISELDRIIKRIYEDQVVGRLSSEWFDKMYADYEAEQETLKKRTVEIEELLEREKEKSSASRAFSG